MIYKEFAMQLENTVRCSWVPGTLNRVRVLRQGRQFEVALELLEKVVGRTATFDLYLKGFINLTLEPEKAERLVA